MVKDGAIVVDIGINRNEKGKLVGDVDFDEVAPKCSFITPGSRRVRTYDGRMFDGECCESGEPLVN